MGLDAVCSAWPHRGCGEMEAEGCPEQVVRGEGCPWMSERGQGLGNDWVWASQEGERVY